MCLFGLSCEEAEVFSGMWKWKVAKRGKLYGFSTFWRKLYGFGFFLTLCDIEFGLRTKIGAFRFVRFGGVNKVVQ